MNDLSSLTAALTARAADVCELCGAADDLAPTEVGPSPSADIERAVLACTTCRAQLAGERDLDAKHWFCLQEAAWSEVPAVQVVAWRQLQRLGAETWARDLLDQIYLEDEVMAWAKAGIETAEATTKTVDANGAELQNGDSVTLIKDLDVKGANFTAKRGTLVKGIRLSEDPELIEGSIQKVGLFLKTCFVKKVTG